MKKFLTIFVAVCCIVAAPLFFKNSFAFPAGHNGEQPPLEYWIEYHEQKGITTVDETGITFMGSNGGSQHEDTILPEAYFGDYPLYFTGGTLSFSLHIKNTGERTYRNLKVATVQEFLNTDGGAGAPFPDQSRHEWFVDTLAGGEEVGLQGSMVIPNLDSSGIDQTHLQIFHWDKGEGDNEGDGAGRLLVDDPQAGLWCPQINEN